MGDRDILKLLIPVILVTFVGTYGFVLIEGWNWSESFYMTIITLSTVGFGEVRPLSEDGRLFVSLLIMCGVGVATYSISRLFAIVVEGELFRKRHRKVMDHRLSQLNQHIVMCGCGRLGQTVLKELEASGESVVVIDNDKEEFEQLDASGRLTVYGSAYEDEILKQAGVERAKTLLTLLPSDADNVYVSLCARDLNPGLTIIARTEDEGGEARLKRAGASEVIAPYSLSGHKIVQMVVRPHVNSFLEIAGVRGQSTLAIEELKVSSDSKLAGKTLLEAEISKKTGAIVAAIISDTGDMLVSPTGTDTIDQDSTLIVLGEKKSLEKMTELL